MNEIIQPVRADIKPGFYQGIPNEAYHAGPGISKSGLWTIHTKSPAHYKYGVRKEKKHFDFGEACHLAILEPDKFETTAFRGPDDRRGNKWKDAEAACANNGKLLLTSTDYDSVLGIRDGVHANPWVNSILTSGKPEIETSGYWIDPATGVLCRNRADVYRADLKIILDVKSAESAHPDAFARSVVNYGYHAQEAFYSDGHRMLGREVDGFAFLVFEKTEPFVSAVYELPPSIVDEGRETMRKALDVYQSCVKADDWPGYGDTVRELSFARWAYRLTEAPSHEDE
jgi:exodeoxyribonuclease VIII